VFVSCVRAGEAKLRGRVRHVLLNAGGSNAQMSCGDSGAAPGLFIFAAMRKGFKVFVEI